MRDQFYTSHTATCKLAVNWLQLRVSKVYTLTKYSYSIYKKSPGCITNNIP